MARGVGGYVILHFRVPTTSDSHICALPPMYPPNIVCLHHLSLQSYSTCALPPRGTKGSEGRRVVRRGVGYVIVGFRVPSISVSHICALPPMYPPDIVHLHPSSLQSSHTPRGDEGSEGVKAGKGSMGGNVILGLSIPTTCASCTCALPHRGEQR